MRTTIIDSLYQIDRMSRFTAFCFFNHCKALLASCTYLDEIHCTVDTMVVASM